MKKIIFLFLFFSLSSYAQNRIVFGAGSAATSRLLDFHNEDYSKEELKQLKNLEVIKPSYFGYLGYVFDFNSKIDMQINIGYRITRYGSRIYGIPSGIPNVTPQYGKVRQVVHQNQFNIDYLIHFKTVKPLRSDYLFVKSSITYNFKNYRIYEVSFNQKNESGITGYRGSEGFVPQRFDLYLGTGLNYNLYKDKLHFQPFLGFFVSPYETDGDYYSYLYFNKNVKGFLLDVGFNLQYRIK
ncbi:hypothetical protein WAF17_05580 [Bernardetia sp. ABR2-2B]|uniref:hypothetical protein n=1 Tax=Bernardetia sp. ABR2-2B TaxID=3127472 RepID=UPI0030D58F39